MRTRRRSSLKKPDTLSYARNLISKEEVLDLIAGSTKHEHSILVSRIMKRLAERFGEDPAEWELVGLLHDLDYDLINGDMTRHGIMATKMLEERLSEEGLYAIKAHDHKTGFAPLSLIDRSLIAADAVAIFIEDEERDDDYRGEALLAKLDMKNTDKPWINDAILTFCRGTGLQLIEFLRLGLNIETGNHFKKDSPRS